MTSTVKLKGHPHSHLRTEKADVRTRFVAGREQTPCPGREESAFSMPVAFQGLRNCQETFRFPGRIRTPSCVLSLSVNFRDSIERTRGRVMGENGAPFTLTAEPRYLLSLVSFAT